MTNLQELLSKPVWQMTGEEFIFLSKHASGQTEMQPQPVTDTERKYVYGILGIAKLFGCSLPTANRIKKSGKRILLRHKQVQRRHLFKES